MSKPYANSTKAELLKELEFLSSCLASAYRSETERDKQIEKLSSIEWEDALFTLVAEKELKGYKKGWLYHKFLTSPICPPLSAWESLGEILSCDPGWAEEMEGKWYERKYEIQQEYYETFANKEFA